MVRPDLLKGDRVRETSKFSYVGWSRRRAPVRAGSRRQGISQQTSKASDDPEEEQILRDLWDDETQREVVIDCLKAYSARSGGGGLKGL
jgi:hypothetical protein